MKTDLRIEQSLIDQLIGQGYTYYNGADIAPTSNNPQRESFVSVLLENHFKASLKKLNPTLPASALAEAFQKVINLGTEDIMENNERFHTMLTNGVTVEFSKEGRTKGINVTLLDVIHPENNSFWVVNQLVVREHNNKKRFDVVVYVNGLPLVFIELKSAADEKATLRRAFTQIQNYKKAVPSVFYYNAICVISDGIDAATSSLSAPFSRYLTWKAPIKEKDLATSETFQLTEAAESPLVYGMTELQTLTKYMLNKKTLVELIRYCTVFEQEEKKDEKTGLISQVKIKKVGAYHQYYVVQKAVEQTLRATAMLPSSNFSQGEKNANYQRVSNFSQEEKDANYQGVSSLSKEEKDAYYSDEYSFSLREKNINYRGNYNFSGLVDKAKALRRNQTSAEKTLWEVLRNKQLLNLKYRRQHQIDDYIVDFYCNELKLVVELDGEYHFTEEQQKKDKKRESYLTSIRNKVIRFRNEEVDTNLESILKTISGLSPLGRDGREGLGDRKIGVV